MAETTAPDATSLLGSIFGGLTQAGGLAALINDIKSQQAGTGATIEGLKGEVTDTSSFQPWSVTSSLGNATMNESGNVDFSLSGQQQGVQDTNLANGMNLLGRASADPAAREQEIYSRIRAAQMPEEGRRYESMNAGLFGSGRGGMTSANYGGSPEQMAFEKARAEADNAAMLGAMGQAQDELTNQYTMGQGMLQSSYMPSQNLLAMSQPGIQSSQLYGQNQQALSGLLAQLGIGGLTTDVNYSNIMGNLYGEGAKAAGAAATGAGDWLSALLPDSITGGV